MYQEHHKHLIPFIISFALFMEAVDSTIINTAIPAISVSLNVNPVDLKIGLISYLLSLAIFIPISGWVADKFGVKRVFICAIALFTLSSIWCGFAQNLPHLVAARSLQGLGGAFTLPVGRLILVRTFKRHELITAMSRVVMVAALGLMLGPVLGGFITHYASWHWIFWVNIPIGLFTILMSWYTLDDVPPKKVHSLDKLGFLLFGIGLAGLTFGLSDLSESNAQKSTAIQIILIAIISLFAYFIHSRKKAHPIVRPELFLLRSFQVSILGNLFSRVSFGGIPFLLPLLLQIGLNYPAQKAGLLIAPMALGVLTVKPFSLRLLRLLGFKNLLILNTFLVGVAIWIFMAINMNTSPYVICCFTFLFGFLISIQYSGMNSLAYAEITEDNFSTATSLMSTMQQLAQSFGVTLGAMLMNYYSSYGAQLTLPIFRHTFFAMGLFTLFSILIFMRLKPEDGAEMINEPISEH
jgi:EmrB/QacA subfamily drug resistance transporter